MRIFISYRRGDYSGMVTAIIAGMLRRHFGDDSVFRDVTSIQTGDRYPDVLRDELRSARGVVAVIDPDWCRVDASSGERALDRPNDWVRWEIRTALESGKPIYPVLLSGAAAPRGDDLPPDLREFAKIQMRHIGETSFEADVMALARELEDLFEPQATPQNHPPTGHSGHGLGRATIAAVALALPAPWVLVLAGVHPGYLLVPGFLLGYCYCAVVGAYLLVNLAIVPARERFLRLDRYVHSLPARLHNETLTRPFVFVILAGFGLLLMVLNGLDFVNVAILLGTGVWAVIYSGVQGARDIEDEQRWPPAVRRPGRNSDYTARRAIAILRAQAATWERPLTLQNRSDAATLLTGLAAVAAELRANSQRSRWSRMVVDRPRITRAALIAAAVAEGLQLPAIPDSLAGRFDEIPFLAFGPYYFPPAMAILALASVETLHRQERWTQRKNADEIDKAVQELGNDLLPGQP